MPTYRATQHAVIRAQERFPEQAATCSSWSDWAIWLGRTALQGAVVAQQAGADLMLRVEVPAAGGSVVYLPVSPVGSGDQWTVRTVLTDEQGRHNIAQAEARHRDAARASWRQRKGFTRPYARTHGLQRHGHQRHLFEDAA
jgi:hypothetical protein